MAFFQCTSLTSIVIPDSVTEIGKDAFLGCPLPEETLEIISRLTPKDEVKREYDDITDWEDYDIDDDDD